MRYPDSQRRWMIGIALLLLIGWSAGWSANSRKELAQQRDRMKEIVAEWQAEAAALRKQRGEHESLLDEVEQLDRQLTAGREQLAKITREQAAGRDQLAGLEESIRTQGAAIAEQRAQLAVHLRLLYGMGEQGFLKLILSQSEPALLQQGIHYSGFLLRARTTRFREFTADLARLKRAREKRVTLLARLDELKTGLEQTEQTLTSRKTERSTLLAQVEKQLDLRQRKLAELENAKQELGSFMTKLEQAIAQQEEAARLRREEEARRAREAAERQAREVAAREAAERTAREAAARQAPSSPGQVQSAVVTAEPSPPPDDEQHYQPEPEPEPDSSTRAAARLPPAPPVPGKFGRIVGERGQLVTPVGARGAEKPPGLFYRVRENQPVVSIYRGHVVYADWFRGYGLLLIVDHGQHVFSLYGHNSRLLVEMGQWVESGQAIAESGGTGSMEGPGLYFEIRHNGIPVSPRSWLRNTG